MFEQERDYFPDYKGHIRKGKEIFSSLLTGATIRFCIFYVSAHAQYECSDRVCCRRAGIHVSTSLVSGTVRTGAIQNHRHCRERALLGIVPAMATAVLYFFAFACSLQLGKVSGV